MTYFYIKILICHLLSVKTLSNRKQPTDWFIHWSIHPMTDSSNAALLSLELVVAHIVLRKQWWQTQRLDSVPRSIGFSSNRAEGCMAQWKKIISLIIITITQVLIKWLRIHLRSAGTVLCEIRKLVVVNSTNAEDLQVIHVVKLLREVHLIEELYGNS